MNPLTVDISDFYGQPPYGQQSTDLIVDKRKTLNTHKKLEKNLKKLSLTRMLILLILLLLVNAEVDLEKIRGI